MECYLNIHDCINLAEPRQGFVSRGGSHVGSWWQAESLGWETKFWPQPPPYISFAPFFVLLPESSEWRGWSPMQLGHPVARVNFQGGYIKNFEFQGG